MAENDAEKKLDQIAEKTSSIKETIRRGGSIPKKAGQQIKEAAEKLKEASDEVDRVNGGQEN